MFEITEPPHVSRSAQSRPDSVDTGDLTDPVGAVIGVELSRRFVRLCLSWAEPMVDDLASQEAMLREPGGIELAERLLVGRLYHRIDPQVFPLVRVGVPLAHARSTLAQVEELLRTQFSEVVRTAIGFLLSHDRDVALQMTAVSATMGGREIRSAASAIISDTHAAEGD